MSAEHERSNVRLLIMLQDPPDQRDLQERKVWRDP